MSLRPPLHVSTFNWRTVVSFRRLCHLFVHALSSLQVANAQCRALRSLAPWSSRSARKTQVRSRKKTSERKKSRLAAGKIRSAAGKSCFRSGKKRQQKMPLRSGKNSKQQKKHLAAAQKHLCSRKNAFWRQREKTVRGGKNPSEARKKPAEAGKKVAAEKVQLCNPKSQLPQRKKNISATGKSSSPQDSTRNPFSLWTGPGPLRGCFQFYFNSRRDQKRARPIHALEHVAILFLGLRHDARNAPSCFKSSPETMKPQKAGKMTQTSTC